MRKLNLAVLSYDRDLVLNALERTHAVEIKEHAETESTSFLASDRETLAAYLSSLEGTLGVISSHAPQTKEGKEALRDGFEVAYSEFLAAKDYRAQADALIENTARAVEERAAAEGEIARLTREIATANPYTMSAVRFSECHDTKHTAVRFGFVPLFAWETLQKALDSLPLTAYEATMSEDGAIVFAVCHKSALQPFEELLTAASFSACPYTGERTGAELLSALEEERRAQEARKDAAERALVSFSSELRPLKIYCDYVGFELEKAEASAKMQTTAHAVFMEAFVPADGEETVKSALDALEIPLYCAFSDPSEDEPVPTLLKNNRVVENFELITNMYSPPNSREMDPNTVMSFFYSLFLGFIMADIGYGLMMLFGGGLLYRKSKKGGLKSLSGVFAVCGVFAIVWGFLFNSLFGLAVLPFTVMPNAQTAMYTVMGIGLPAVLVISLMLGVIQLMAGYLCKAVQTWRRSGFWDGVFDGVVWAVFSLGVEIALFGLVEEFHASVLTAAGGIVAGVSLVVAVFTAGRKQKFLGKITKGFGSLYALIGYFSDVLSYLRLYALMLTGAIIAQVVSQYALAMLTSGSFLAVVGVFLMIVGHIFNLAIGLLGAYIHTARLQYIEFFGKFYEGDGVLFVPLGSERKYIDLKNAA